RQSARGRCSPRAHPPVRKADAGNRRAAAKRKEQAVARSAARLRSRRVQDVHSCAFPLPVRTVIIRRSGDPLYTPETIHADMKLRSNMLFVKCHAAKRRNIYLPPLGAFRGDY